MGYTSKKQLISNLKEKYTSVLKWDDGYCIYDNKEDNYSKFKAFINIDKGKYIFQGKSYTNVDDLSRNIDEYNKSLPFDSDIYDPSYRKHILIEKCCHEYLLKLGFVYSNNDTYIYINPFTKKEMFNIIIKVDEDKTSGIVEKIISDFRWMEQKFEDIDSAIAAINSMISYDALIVATESVKILNTMSKLRNYENIENKNINMSTLSIQTKDMKDEIISMLEKELETLKNS